MYSLPDEILFRILYSVPGEDVFRFRRINSQFNRVITKNRQSLQRPWNSLTIGKWLEQRENCEEFHFKLETKRGSFTAVVPFLMNDLLNSYFHSVEPHDLVPEGKAFFAPFGDYQNKTMVDLLLYFFSKGDISVLTVKSEMVREGLRMLRSAIEKSDCRFKEVRLGLPAITEQYRGDTLGGYLKAIAEKEKQKNSGLEDDTGTLLQKESHLF